MERIRIRTLPALCTAATLVAAGPCAAFVSVANYVPSQSSEPTRIGDFSCVLTYTYTGGTSGTVSMLMTNTNTAAQGGYITGLAVNADSSLSGIAFGSCTNLGMLACPTPVPASPFGTFDAGAALGGNWLGGGSPNAGIGVGQSATFVFSVSGTAAALGALTADTVLDSDGYAMVVRFRGGEGGWSDKVTGVAAPAPGAIALLGACGLMASPRRRK